MSKLSYSLRAPATIFSRGQASMNSSSNEIRQKDHQCVGLPGEIEKKDHAAKPPVNPSILKISVSGQHFGDGRMNTLGNDNARAEHSWSRVLVLRGRKS